MAANVNVGQSVWNADDIINPVTMTEQGKCSVNFRMKVIFGILVKPKFIKSCFTTIYSFIRRCTMF